MAKKESITVAAFFDGRPGHEKQTRGILDRLAAKINTEILPIHVERSAAGKQAVQLIQLFLRTKFAGPDLSRCDLLMGAGTPTHIPILQAKRYYNIPAVICMTPLPFLRGCFDLIIAPRHDNVGKAPNIFYTTGPPNSNRDERNHHMDKVLVLCGGVDEKNHIWNSGAVVGDIERLIHADSSKEYTISTSPRTPVDTSISLQALADRNENIVFYDFKDTPSGWVENEYQKSGYVWVTGDSVSMVYEALSSGCRVGILPVKWRRKEPKFKKSLDYLYGGRHVISLEQYLEGAGGWKENAVFDEAKRCADEIVNRYLWNHLK